MCLCLFYIFVLFCKLFVPSLAEVYSNLFVIEAKTETLQSICSALGEFSFQYQRKIVGNFHILKKLDLTARSEEKWFDRRVDAIINLSQVRYFKQQTYQSIGWHRPEPVETVAFTSSDSYQHGYFYKLACEALYDMGVEEAWGLNYSGKGVVVAVVDCGVQMNHTDLQANMLQNLSRNFRNKSRELNGNPNPAPWSWKDYPETKDTYGHGTMCAGVIGAIKGNGVCSRGVASNSSMCSLVLLEAQRNTDLLPETIATALSFSYNNIDIFSCSWGTTDGTCGYRGQEKEIVAALKLGATEGRLGKGSPYIFPAGNGGSLDNCNADGYANSVYTITIGSIGVNGAVPSFAERCSVILASTFSEGSRVNLTYITTTTIDDGESKCTNSFHGSSLSVAFASGIIALLLESNPTLTKRDVEHIIVETASCTDDLKRNSVWTRNAANRSVSPHFGFGVMRADAMIRIAQNWTLIPEQRICRISFSESRSELHGQDANKRLWSAIFRVSKCPITSIEYVQVQIQLQTTDLNSLEMNLTSPMGTESPLMTRRPEWCERQQTLKWSFTTVYFWDEDPTGQWTLRLVNVDSHYRQDYGTFKNKMFLVIYGYRNDSFLESTTTLSTDVDVEDSVSTVIPTSDSQGVLRSSDLIIQSSLTDSDDGQYLDVEEKHTTEPDNILKTVLLLVLAIVCIAIFVAWARLRCKGVRKHKYGKILPQKEQEETKESTC